MTPTNSQQAESIITQTRFVNTDQPPKQENFLSGTKHSRIGFVLGAALLGALTGCIGYGDRPPQARAYAPPPPVYVESGVAVQDNYVYYPDYQVYYRGNTRQYVYREGRSWVSRPAPPHVSVDVMFASPSVRLDFHDSPAIHHAAVVRQYPKHWTPQGSGRRNHQGHDEGNKKGHD